MQAATVLLASVKRMLRLVMVMRVMMLMLMMAGGRRRRWTAVLRKRRVQVLLLMRLLWLDENDGNEWATVAAQQVHDGLRSTRSSVEWGWRAM